MPRLIICEGIDSTGKSTLSRFLSQELNAFYFHASGHKSLYNGMFAQHELILQNAIINLQNGHNVVLDRHWPSELAYATVLRPELVDKYNFIKMVAMIEKLKPIYVHCTSENGWERYLKTHSDHDTEIFKRLTKENYFAIMGEYKQIFQNVDHIPYSIEEHGMTQHNIVNKIMDVVP